MLRTRILIAALALLACSLPMRAQDDESRALVLKAIQAAGGKETLAKYKAAQVKYKGEVDFMGMPAKVEGEVFVNYGDRMKNVIGVEINNMNLKISQGFDGKIGWMDVMGMVMELKDKELIDEMKESMHAEAVTNLAVLDSKDYKLSSLGQMKVMGKEAVGVRVSKEGKRDVILWLDKKTHFVIKSEHRGKDPFNPASSEVNEEKYYDRYKAVQGVQTPQYMEVHHDGKKIVSLELTEARLHERPLEDSTFAKP